ncbi:MAG TPA: DUF255 domain-containing protein [Thermoanaerobaculia bacterium]|nr:DUF255 domain-containing protein [Thermoanaerobaculia bacterium]
MRRLILLLAIALVALPSHAADSIHWVSWSDDVFARAKRENRFVLLDLEAVWCHWCHVMDEMTYSDAEVIKLINARYIAVRVDQDSRPDLSNQYEDYGWPATIVFAADRSEIVKRSGYIPPKPMASMLQAIIDDPTPGPSVVPEPKLTFASGGALGPTLRASVEQAHREFYDAKNGAWGFSHKYLDPNSVEYSLSVARHGDADGKRMARQTLTAERALLDPAWGGVYQYSTGGVWSEPHFEKIMAMQAGNLRVAALAYELWGDPGDLATAEAIHRFLDNFLRDSDGAFYTSQDADVVEGEHSAEYFAASDAERRKRGIPRVDKHIYARENGWAIEALVRLYEATGKPETLAEATRAAQWVLAHLHNNDGGFRHGVEAASNSGGPYLADTLAMGRAMLALYEATADRAWLNRAESAAVYIRRTFKASPGYLTAPPGPLGAKRQRDENIDAARFANLLYRYGGRPADKTMAANAMRYVAAEGVADLRPVGGVLLADLELQSEPLHITVVGGKKDPAAQALFTAALRTPSAYKRIDWQEPGQKPLPNTTIQYPVLSKAAAFLCTENRCSRPMYAASDLAKMLR